MRQPRHHQDTLQCTCKRPQRKKRQEEGGNFFVARQGNLNIVLVTVLLGGVKYPHFHVSDARLFLAGGRDFLFYRSDKRRNDTCRHGYLNKEVTEC